VLYFDLKQLTKQAEKGVAGACEMPAVDLIRGIVAHPFEIFTLLLR
jgi:hypothetical protein